METRPCTERVKVTFAAGDVLTLPPPGYRYEPVSARAAFIIRCDGGDEQVSAPMLSELDAWGSREANVLQVEVCTTTGQPLPWGELARRLIRRQHGIDLRESCEICDAEAAPEPPDDTGWDGQDQAREAAAVAAEAAWPARSFPSARWQANPSYPKV